MMRPMMRPMMRHVRRLAFTLFALSALPIALAAPSQADDGRRGGRHGQYVNPGGPGYGDHDRRSYRRPGLHHHRRGGHGRPYRQFRRYPYAPIIILPPYHRRHQGHGYYRYYRSDAGDDLRLGFAGHAQQAAIYPQSAPAGAVDAGRIAR